MTPLPLHPPGPSGAVISRDVSRAMCRVPGGSSAGISAVCCQTTIRRTHRRQLEIPMPRGQLSASWAAPTPPNRMPLRSAQVAVLLLGQGPERPLCLQQVAGGTLGRNGGRQLHVMHHRRSTIPQVPHRVRFLSPLPGARPCRRCWWPR